MSPPGDPRRRTGHEEAWRCFVAISLTDPARTAVVEYLEDLRATVGGVAWTRSDHLHLTLAFLGNVRTTRVPALTERLRLGLASATSFTLDVAGVGAFPNLARPQVLWVGLAAAALAPLADAVQTACAAAGFPRESRPFRPHVTLGRVRTRSRREAPDVTLLTRDGAREFGSAPVENVTLFRSELGAGGARHSPIVTFPLVEAVQIP